MTRIFTRGALAALALGGSTGALAQANVQPQDDGTAADEVIVTAQRLEQRIEDVPVTVTALTGARLRDIGASELDEIAAFVPGLQVQEQSANNPGFVIRGITSDSGSAQQGARVTLYYNGVDVSRSRGAYQDLYDLERIEVVKGPQATLFGTAAAVGAIGIVSARPRAGLEAGLNASYGNFDRTQVSGFVNLGDDTLAARIAFAYKYRDGYVRNIAGDPDVPNQNGGRVDQDDLNGQDQRGVRGSIRWRPTDAVTADLVLTYDGQRNPGTAFKSRAFAPTGGQTGDYGYAELSGSPFSREVLGKRKLGLDRDVYDANLSVSVELGAGVTFTTINGYRRFDSLETFDADGGPAWYLEFAEDAQGDQWSHEGRFAFSGDTYRAAFGWNFFHENGFQRVPFSTEEGTYLTCTGGLPANIRGQLAAAGVPSGPGCVLPNGTVAAARATALLSGGRFTEAPYASEFTNFGNNDTYSVFADATWIPTPAIELTAGARVLIEDRQSRYSSIQPFSQLLAAAGAFRTLLPTANTGGARFEARRSFAAVLPRFNVLFRATDGINLYATASKGRRSPVVQLSATALPATGGIAGTSRPNLQLVPEETVWNYEAGVKAGLGGLTGTASVFYQTYDGFQVNVVGADGFSRTESAGSANNIGVELEATYAFSPAFSVFGSFAYLDGGIGDDAENGVFAGNSFRLQPDTTASAGATLRLPLGGLTLYATPTATYRSKVFFELPNREAIAQDGFVLVNLRAGLEGPEGRWFVGGFARNLGDEEYLIDAGNTGGGFGVPTYIAGEPRFYGVEAGVRF